MSGTVLERDMLRTRVPERDMSVTTALHQTHARACPPWTGVWAHWDGRPESIILAWLHFWPEPVTPGGLAEAHASVVARVARGAIPALDEELPTRRRERVRAGREEQADA